MIGVINTQNVKSKNFRVSGYDLFKTFYSFNVVRNFHKLNELFSFHSKYRLFLPFPFAVLSLSLPPFGKRCMTKGNLFKIKYNNKKTERISGERADLCSPEIFLKIVRQNIIGFLIL